jgi:uncharacterized protein YdeI (YjbR/CyaY-like superfamily)
MPSFDYKGPLCGFAAFKEHCAFGFWKTSLINDPKGYLQPHKAKGGDAMGNLGCITSIKDLPPDRVMMGFIKQAFKLNEAGIKVEKKKPSTPKKLVMHDAFVKALNKNKTAKTFFNSLAPGQQREYADWINEAKTDATRDKRITTSLEWLADGKKRHWKYEKQTMGG